MKTFRITELGKRFGLSRSTLLYYDRIGLLQPSGRTEAGYREYTRSDADRLERICTYREAGLELGAIAALLERSEQGAWLLERRLGEIGQEIAGLRTQQRLLAGLLRTATGELHGSGLDRDSWLSLQRACGLDETALKRWHHEFERRSSEAHHEFLAGLGLSEKECIQVRMLTRDMEGNAEAMRHFHELFDELPRQAPGCHEATLRALDAVRRHLPPRPRVLDIGCGSGLPTCQIARELKDARILAIDTHRPALERLAQAAQWEGLPIETRELSMIDMPFEPEGFDLLWAEGALFILGLERSLRELAAFLAPGGHLAFTELCWFTDDPPEEPKTFFADAYPDIRTDAALCRLAEAMDWEVVERFRLPDRAWWDDYYVPMLSRMEPLKARYADVPGAQAVYAAREAETDMFRRHSKSYGYAFFVLRKKVER